MHSKFENFMLNGFLGLKLKKASILIASHLDIIILVYIPENLEEKAEEILLQQIQIGYGSFFSL